MTSEPSVGPLFILGAPRSGTSQMLRLARDVLGYRGGDEGSVWQSVKALDDHFRRVAHGLADADPEGLRGFSLMRLSREKIVHEYVRSLIGFHEREYGAGPLVDKTPGGEMIAAAPILKAHLPSARFIFMKRRGIENVLSQGRRFPSRTFEAACQQWARPMQRWLEVRDTLKPDCIEVDQWELDATPAAVARRVTAFLGRGDPGEVERYLATHFPEKTQVGRYSEYVSLQNTRWDEQQQQHFCDTCAELMSAFGYVMDRGDGVIASGEFVDLVASPNCERWKVQDANQWIDTRGPGLRLHPNAADAPPVRLRLGGALKPGRYRFEAEALVFDERCAPHRLVMSVSGAASPRTWSVSLEGARLGRVSWTEAVIEVEETSDLELEVVLDDPTGTPLFSATQLVSALFTQL